MPIINPSVINISITIDDALSLIDKNHACFVSKKTYNKYINLVNYHFKRVQKHFPLLKIFHRNMKASYFYGFAVEKEDIDLLDLQPINYRKFGICIFGYITPFFDENNVEAAKIYDLYQFIDYDYLYNHFYSICHLDNTPKYPFYHICTNKSFEIKKDNFIFTPVSVARRLYLEYLKVDCGGFFSLDCHEHGGTY